MIVVKFTEMIANVGVGSALIQKQKINDRHISISFLFVIVLGFLIYFIFLFLLNPILGSFFNQLDLVNVLNLICISIPFNMFSQICYSLLQKKFKFKSLAGLDIFSYTIGYGFVGIFLAYLNYGVFSLVWAIIIQSILYAIFLYYINPFKISLKFYRKELNELLFSGSGFIVSDFFNYFARNGDYLIISKYIGIEALGLYSRAYTLMNAVDRIIGKVINKVMFSTFSKVQNNKIEITKILNRTVGILFLFLIPISFYCYLFAEEIIIIILGKKWLSILIPYKILLIGMTFRVGYKLLASCLKGIGYIKYNLFFQFIYMSIILIGSYIVSDYGISGIALVVSFALLIHFSLQVYFLFIKKLISINLVFKKFFNVIPITILVLFTLFYINQFLIIFSHPIHIIFFSIIYIFIFLMIILQFNFTLLIPSDFLWLYKKLKNNK